MRGASVDELEQYAWALWFVHSRVQSLAAIATNVRVDVTTVDESTTLRERMPRVLDCSFENHPGMQFQLADIRSGQGYATRGCNLRVRQASNGPRSARNTPLGLEHAPQAHTEPGEMRRQQARVVYAPPGFRRRALFVC
jgi:hypothetical protein